MSKNMFFSFLIFSLFGLNLSALEISMKGAKENHQAFSTLHIKNNEPFLCEEQKNDFGKVSQIVCAFSKSPSKKIKNLQNSFFKVDSQTKQKTFFLIIKPFEKMKLYPMIFDLTKDETVFTANVKLSKHWTVIGYKEKLPFIKDKVFSDVAINFPFTFKEEKYPFVGSLDIEGNPVHIQRVSDVTEFIKIKKLYKNKSYDKALDLIDEILYDYPNSLFRAELYFYKIKSFEKMKDYENVINISKEYLREYSSDENIPEVLALVSRAYFIEGYNTNAEYFFDRLFSEHANSVYAKWGLVYRGEMYESLGSAQKAINYYRRAISETKNIDVAVAAAFRLANYLSIAAKDKEANKYIQKIAKAKPKYFKEMMQESLDMMYAFADNEAYLPAATIAKCLSDSIGPDWDEYEGLIADSGVWLSKTDKKQESLVRLNSYLKKYPDGDFSYDAQVAKDSLFFDVNDSNFTVKIQNYDKLIEDYQSDSIGNKAIFEKAKLLVKNEKYRQAIDMEEDLLSLDDELYPEVPDLITDAAIGTMEVALEKKECDSVLAISTQFKIELSDKWDDGIYECAMKGADFELAKKMADKNMKSKDLEQRKKWLYRYIKIDFATGNYTNVIQASKELITLVGSNKKSEYLDVYRILFDTYSRLENNDKMIDSLAKVEKIYGLTYKDIERYVSVMNIGSVTNDNNLVILYATKVMKIQKSSISFAQSPFVEFTLYQAYSKKEDYIRALEVIKSLDNVKLSDINRARQLYLLGSVYDSLWRDDDAKNAYKRVIEIDKDSPWAELAKGAMKI